MAKTLIFTATYNEKENIEELVNRINKLNIDLDILVIDDNSPDETWKILKKLENNKKNLKVIIRDNKYGLDTAHKLAFDYAKNKNYEKFISMDADLSHDPNEIPKMINTWPILKMGRPSLAIELCQRPTYLNLPLSLP